MRACVQRVSRAKVTVDETVVGSIDCGLVVLLGVGREDDESDVSYLAKKIVRLRIFPDDDGKMNQSLIDTGGELLAISQFTLLGDVRKGRRPSFISAADPDSGKQMYQSFIAAVRSFGVTVATGEFQANMQVELINDGPVTILMDSTRVF